ncbi:S41 family peptidase, partial [Flavobacterium sp. 3-210]
MNWDTQLLEKLPLIEKAQTQKEFSLILENWIDDLGPVKEIAPIAVPKDIEHFDKNFDLSWFNGKLCSKKLSKKLKF